MSTFRSDYFGLRFYETRQREIEKEMLRLQQLKEALKAKPAGHRLRLPRITIHWN